MKSKIVVNSFLGKIKEIDKSDLKWRISAYGILIKNSKILLCENQINQIFSLPGGAVELGESVSEALIRELLEETGMRVDIVKFFGYKERFFYFDPTKDTSQSLQLFFEVKSIESTVPRSDDIEKPIWLDVDKILSSQKLILQPHFEIICDHLKSR